jgi:NAD(P)-dependent dehydrogenase (short-subunit alcohol dehydrogenase family)
VDLDDSVVIITGGGTGIGAASARAVSAHGAHVVLAGRRPDRIAQVADELRAARPDRTALAVATDVTVRADVRALAAVTLETFGRIDVLVNNAGYGSVGALEEIDIDELKALHETMFIGPARLVQAVLPGMRERGSGTIVQMSSMGGQLAPPGFGAYCSAKFALEAISESLAAEVAQLGIRVLIVEPGAFRTEFGADRMHRSATIIDYYTPTVGPTRAAIDAMDGSQPGDPNRAAAAIIETVNATRAPLRLALGDDAVDSIRAKHQQLSAELQGWESLSRSTALADKPQPQNA